MKTLVAQTLGQFAEMVYTPIPIGQLLTMLPKLIRPEYPLAGYDALLGAELIRSFEGTVADLPVHVYYRTAQKQIVLAIAGTTTATHAAYDVAALKTKHPSGGGYVHLGFWSIYEGLSNLAVESLQQGLRGHEGHVEEVIITGHSMGNYPFIRVRAI